MREALALYGRALEDAGASSGPAGPLLRFDDGASLPFAVCRYLAAADPLDRRLLDGVQGPVLDVGCGPGRHLRELTARGVYALGVDLSTVAVELARSGGARAVVADIFGDVPGAGDLADRAAARRQHRDRRRSGAVADAAARVARARWGRARGTRPAGIVDAGNPGTTRDRG